MNMDKTKIIWIGCKKHSKDKLNVSCKLQWGNTVFNLLDLDFTTSLNENLNCNYDKAWNDIKKTIAHWRNSYLTPLGKVTLIKTLFLPLCIIMLTSSERSEKLLSDLNQVFLAYWPIGHTLLAWPCVVVVNIFSSLFSSETTAQNTSKLYIQLPYIRVYKNSSFHVDLIVDVDFIGLWNF